MSATKTTVKRRLTGTLSGAGTGWCRVRFSRSNGRGRILRVYYHNFTGSNATAGTFYIVNGATLGTTLPVAAPLQSLSFYTYTAAAGTLAPAHATTAQLIDNPASVGGAAYDLGTDDDDVEKLDMWGNVTSAAGAFVIYITVDAEVEVP